MIDFVSAIGFSCKTWTQMIEYDKGIFSLLAVNGSETLVFPIKDFDSDSWTLIIKWED